MGAVGARSATGGGTSPESARGQRRLVVRRRRVFARSPESSRAQERAFVPRTDCEVKERGGLCGRGVGVSPGSRELGGRAPAGGAGLFSFCRSWGRLGWILQSRAPCFVGEDDDWEGLRTSGARPVRGAAHRAARAGEAERGGSARLSEAEVALQREGARVAWLIQRNSPGGGDGTRIGYRPR